MGKKVYLQMNIDYTKVQNMAFSLADGIAVVYPVSLPFIKIAEAAIRALDLAGIQPTVISTEQATAIQAGMAAARASAVVAYRAHEGNPPKDSFDNLKLPESAFVNPSPEDKK